MFKRRRGAGLAEKAFAVLRFLRDLGLHDLDGDLAGKSHIIREIDPSHAALAENFREFVAAEMSGEAIGSILLDRHRFRR